MIDEAQDGLVTKHDLTKAKNEIKADMNVRFERIDGELKLNRWMLGVLLAGVISLVLKAFFLALCEIQWVKNFHRSIVGVNSFVLSLSKDERIYGRV